MRRQEKGRRLVLKTVRQLFLALKYANETRKLKLQVREEARSVLGRESSELWSCWCFLKRLHSFIQKKGLNHNRIKAQLLV